MASRSAVNVLVVGCGEQAFKPGRIWEQLFAVMQLLKAWSELLIFADASNDSSSYD